ncbi:MAG: SpoIIE family protein phosphatase, partial [Opitutales bacterium]|nr:SpoIIE family protein phosphatase [Opitutales bacterium]
LRAQNKMNVLIGLVGGVLLLGASIVVAFSLTRPLHELAAAAGRLATGDFETPLPSVRRGDEIGRLTSSFARMREELHSYIEELTTTTAAKEKIASELAIAHQIQLGIVPKLFPPFPERGDLDLFATLVPAREVGGDLYDFTLLDEDHLYVAIGDVSGKGVPASLLMAVGKTLLKSTIQAVRDPARAMTMVNDELSADNESCMFITAFCAILNLHTGQLTFANAGHNPPIIVSKDGTTRFIQRKPGPALGVMPAVRYVNKDMTLENDDMLLLYTDGVTEAMNDKSELFGEERMARIASDNAKASAQKLIKAMVDSISTHAHGVEQSDDITMLAVRSTAQKALRAPDAPERAPDAKILLGNNHEGLEHMVSWLERSAETLGIPPETVMALNLALEEWFVNIISYAYSDSAAHDVEIRMWKDDKQILVQIEDDGQPFDPCAQAAPDTQASLEQRKIGGLGIHFIRKTMDLMHYRRENGRNILTLAKLISK